MIRAILIGLGCGALISGVDYFFTDVIRQYDFNGNTFTGGYLPKGPFAIFFMLLLINPLLFRLRKSLALTGKQFAVTLTVMIIGSFAPAGLMTLFSTDLMFPHHYSRVEAGWQEHKILEAVNPRMLPEIKPDSREVLDGFMQGMAIGTKHISFSQIPWHALKRTLMFWIPLLILLWIAMMALSLVVHRQWSQHEHLPYPIARFVEALLPSPGEARSGIFSNRLFWIGAGIILFIDMNNYTAKWFPNWIQIPTSFDFTGFKEMFATLSLGGGDKLLNFKFHFLVLGFAYFIATDVSLSMGIGPFVYYTLVGVFAGYGISVANTGLSFPPSVPRFIGFGAYLGLFLFLLFTGRHYYKQVFKSALFLDGKTETDASAQWGMRIFLVASLGFASILVTIGLDWQIALLYTGLLLLMFLMMSRIVAETGLIGLQTSWFPSTVLIGLLGVKVLGVSAMVTLNMVTAIAAVLSYSSFMPMAANSLKILENQNVPAGRTAILWMVAILLSVLVAVPVTFYFQYDQGKGEENYYVHQSAREPFDLGVQASERLVSQGNLEVSKQMSGWARFAQMAPDVQSLYGLGIGFVLVALVAGARLRFPSFPLHPVMFLSWSTWTGKGLAFSFLVGFVLKVVITKYGGHQLYQKVKPLMFGVIAGALISGVLPPLIGAAYYFITGEMPKTVG